MIEVKQRSEAAWGLLSSETCDDETFLLLAVQPQAKQEMKNWIKKKAKMKRFRIAYTREWGTKEVIIEAESESDVPRKAREYFNKHKHDIDFRMKEDCWLSTGYDRISYVKVR